MDEGGTVFMATQTTFSNLIGNLKTDFHPPLYYLTLHCWINLFGSSTFSIRFLPVLLGSLVVFAIFYLAKYLFTEKVGLIAAFILAVSPINIVFSQVSRSYSLTMLLTILSVYFFIRFIKAGNKKMLLHYTVVSLAMIYTFYYTFIIIIIQNIFLLVMFKKYKGLYINWIISQFAIFLLYLPWIPILKPQFAFAAMLGMKESLNFTLPNANNIFIKILMIFYQFSVGYFKVNLYSKIFYLISAGAAIAFFVPFLKFILQFKKDKENTLLLLSFLLLPFPIVFAIWIGGFQLQLAYARHFLFISPIYFIAVAKGIASFKNLDYKIFPHLSFAVIFLILIALVGSVAIYDNYTYRTDRENWHSTVNFLDENYNSNDIVLIYPAQSLYNFQFYAKGGFNLYTLPGELKIGPQMAPFNITYSQGQLSQISNCSFLSLIKSDTTGIWYIKGLPFESFQNPEFNDTVNECISNYYKFDKKFFNEWQDVWGAKNTDLLLYRYSTK